MKFYILFAASFLVAGCQLSTKETQQETDTIPFYIGTYTGNGSEGIYRYQLNSDGMLDSIGLAAKSNNPSFLARSGDGKFIVAVSEIDRQGGESAVKSFKIDGDRLEFLSESPSGGAHPCFVTMNDDRFVLVANYTGGNVGLLKVDTSGKLSDLLDLEIHEGSGITDRQKSPHAHSAWFVPGSNEVISVDLGTNELWFSRLDNSLQKLVPADPQKLAMNPGAGPRHLSFHPKSSHVYVLNELDCTVTILEKTAENRYAIVANVSTLPEGFSEKNTCADIHVSSDGNFLYASNRGHNSIAIFRIDPDTGLPEAIGHQSTHGEVPRNFSLTPDNKFLLVANQVTGNIVSFKRDSESGLLTFGDKIDVPSPVCILF